jgi:hypothetical protein
MIVNILAGFLFSYYFVNIAGIPNAIKKGFSMMPHQRIKPFDCVTCLSVWSSVAFYLLPTQLVEFICIIFASGFLGSKIK